MKLQPTKSRNPQTSPGFEIISPSPQNPARSVTITFRPGALTPEANALQGSVFDIGG
jgi:hypothetical protein